MAVFIDHSRIYPDKSLAPFFTLPLNKSNLTSSPKILLWKTSVQNECADLREVTVNNGALQTNKTLDCLPIAHSMCPALKEIYRSLKFQFGDSKRQ